jgi:hypothetical protein
MLYVELVQETKHILFISLRQETWADKTSLTLELFIEVSVPSHESRLSYTCVLRVSILPLSTIFYQILELFYSVSHILCFSFF